MARIPYTIPMLSPTKLHATLTQFSPRGVLLIAAAIASLSFWSITQRLLYGKDAFADPTHLFWLVVMFTVIGATIALAVAYVAPWDTDRPIVGLLLAVFGGTAAGMLLYYIIKYLAIGMWGPFSNREGLVDYFFTWVNFSFSGLIIGFFFLIRIRDNRIQHALHRAEAERQAASRQALEAELKLLQAQVEPHFLYNTLANVQFLVESDPPAANRMLEHLIQYLHAAIPQVRQNSATLGQELKLIEAYLNILRMRMGKRLAFSIDCPSELSTAPCPPMMLLSLVENAIKHGIEPQAEGGTIEISVTHQENKLRIVVADDGRGLTNNLSDGVGLYNLRERLLVLYGNRASFSLAQRWPKGVEASIVIPYDNDQSTAR